jgi:branched-chain amino acid transport system permease protein
LRYGEIKQKPGASRYESTLVLAVNSITLGGLLFLLVPLRSSADAHSNLTHGSLFMLGAYIGASLVVWYKLDFWLAAIVSALLVAAFGGLIERLLLRRLAGNSLAQVLVTLGIAFMIADACLMAFTGDPITVPTPAGLVGAVRGFGLIFPIYRLVVILIAVVIAVAPGLPIARAWAR